ncbi:uncharacterized protein BDZ99DRAFT_525116 [Mytilinidion resinicola]|uniref:Uncharacterized protein n=1 Tax=Mytilinidion resinicola TaxID=574789 RepID=A0A6A6Y7G8_9PEZI|nr:uncharacterized protein BDZ99DRAFT_525116 [Mytilinidion resinicola]KAF2804762.1 hypothetical protein BDZ99DRAFT_525116 [Mytilinidion resinicola]
MSSGSASVGPYRAMFVAEGRWHSSHWGGTVTPNGNERERFNHSSSKTFEDEDENNLKIADEENKNESDKEASEKKKATECIVFKINGTLEREMSEKDSRLDMVTLAKDSSGVNKDTAFHESGLSSPHHPLHRAHI